METLASSNPPACVMDRNNVWGLRPVLMCRNMSAFGEGAINGLKNSTKITENTEVSSLWIFLLIFILVALKLGLLWISPEEFRYPTQRLISRLRRQRRGERDELSAALGVVDVEPAAPAAAVVPQPPQLLPQMAELRRPRTG